MLISNIIKQLETLAHPALQESYDNCGLITGNAQWKCTGIICTLDATEAVVSEAIENHCNLIVAHHPIIFSGLKKINGNNYVEKTIIRAIKHDIAIYAIHTNLDNILIGVNGKIASLLGLKDTAILHPKKNMLSKISVFVPTAQAEELRTAIFKAGGGHIGNYSECSFNTEGIGSFKPAEGTNPLVGEIGTRHYEKEVQIEFIVPQYQSRNVLQAIKYTHPYEEVAYFETDLKNTNQGIGAGIVGNLDTETDIFDFFNQLKVKFHLAVIKHTVITNTTIKKVAVCGGAGSYLIQAAQNAGAQLFITSDVKYHEFFDANNNIIIADIGHYESEQFTINILEEYLREKITNFAVLKSKINTNPVNYY